MDPRWDLVAALNANLLKKSEPQDGVFRQVQVPFRVIRHSPSMHRKARTFGNMRTLRIATKAQSTSQEETTP